MEVPAPSALYSRGAASQLGLGDALPTLGVPHTHRQGNQREPARRAHRKPARHRRSPTHTHKRRAPPPAPARPRAAAACSRADPVRPRPEPRGVAPGGARLFAFHVQEEFRACPERRVHGLGILARTTSSGQTDSPRTSERRTTTPNEPQVRPALGRASARVQRALAPCMWE